MTDYSDRPWSSRFTLHASRHRHPSDVRLRSYAARRTVSYLDMN
ncbi:MAG: hypothetical protein OQJ89_03085 [Kangiellaceae bacterium]|nr:hypothetical protein [Kangiellaceae bacterium]